MPWSLPTIKRKMNGNKTNSDGEGGAASEPDESDTVSASERERESEIESGGGDGINGTDSFEEECVICLEPLSSEPWGRCTPCNHAFHTKCWWDWENAHNERVDQRQGNRARDDGPKCCLCNTVNKQFVDGTGEPAHNPSPFVASEDSAGEGIGNRFTNWFREVGEEASGFMEFLASDLRESAGAGPFPFNRSQSRRNTNADRDRGDDAARNNTSNRSRRSSSFIPPIFGSRSNGDRRSSFGGSASSPHRSGLTPPFSMSPLFRNLSSHLSGQQEPWASSWSSAFPNSNPFNQMRPGTRIITQHLVNSPHLNGRNGSIIQYQPQSSRYLVQFEANISSFIGGDSTAPVAIRPGNLLQTGVKVKIHGLQSQPRYNGKEGIVSSYSKERNRYVVQITSLLSPSIEISVKPTNIRIGNGMCVRLEGLQRTPQWNQKYGTIVGWMEDESGTSGSGRYEVQLSRQYSVRVKMENVRL